MNNRRQFFGQLSAILVASTAPAVFIPSEPIGWKPNVIYRPRTFKSGVRYTPELVQDLQAYHDINAEKEVWGLIRDYVCHELEILKGAVPEILDIKVGSADEATFDQTFLTPRFPIIVTINERVEL